MEISKAQAKRNKDKFNLLTNRMTKNLMEFKNAYIGDYVMYEINQIERVANAFKKSCIEAVKKDVIGKSLEAVRKTYSYSFAELECFDCDRNHAAYRYDDTITGVATYKVEKARRRLELIELEKFQFYTEAVKSYEVKFNKLIQGMMPHDWNHRMVIEDVANVGGQFAVLVYNPKSCTSDKQDRINQSDFFYHARLIYTQGDVVRPHFRFITTTRKTYLS